MKTTIAASACVENSLANSVALQVVRAKYDIPTDMFGPMTDANIVGAQSSMEKTYTAMIVALAGVNIVSGAGMLDSVGAISPIQLLIDNEMMGIIRRTLRGVQIDDETLAGDVIGQVAEKHNFLETEHTFKHFKSEYFMPELCSRHSRASWELSEKKDIIARAKQKAKKILAEHNAAALPDKAIDKIKAVIAKADKNS